MCVRCRRVYAAMRCTAQSRLNYKIVIEFPGWHKLNHGNSSQSGSPSIRPTFPIDRISTSRVWRSQSSVSLSFSLPWSLSISWFGTVFAGRQQEPQLSQQYVSWKLFPTISDHSRIWSQPGKAVPGSHLPTGHIGQLNRAQSKAAAGPMYSKFRTPSPSEHSHVVPKHQLRSYPPPQKKNFF